MNENNRPVDDLQENEAGKSAQTQDFMREGTPDGREYTTPGGSHGYVYAPATAKEGFGIRKVAVTLFVAGSIILTMGFGVLGAWLAAGSDEEEPGSDGEENTQYVYEIPGTSDGLVIMEGDGETTSHEVYAETLHAADGAESGAAQVGSGQNTASGTEGDDRIDEIGEGLAETPDISDKATVSKKSAQRADADGDGRADAAFDAAGSVLTSAGENVMNTATVVAKIAASVVEISTETVVQSNREQYTTGGAGSGVIIAKEGYIVTNHHVIDGADNITVRLNNGKIFAATLVGTDEATDIAVLHVDAGEYELTVAPLGSSYDLVAGEDVIAIGNPLGSLGGTVTEGIISATARRINMDGNVMTLLQVSAPINPGNSGGGLFNMAGELVGVVNAKVASEDIEGLGFAIPVDVAYDMICQLIEYRYVRGRVTSGLTLVDVTSAITAMQYFNSRYTGVYITESTVCADLQYGDLLLTVDGKEITEASQVRTSLSGKRVGDTLELVVYRKGQEITVTLTLAEYVPSYVTE